MVKKEIFTHTTKCVVFMVVKDTRYLLPDVKFSRYMNRTALRVSIANMPCAINMAKSFLILVALHIIYLIILRLKWIGNITPLHQYRLEV